jgi:hypothetical protein
VILVLASRADAVAAEFVRFAAGAGAHVALVAPDDLSRPGWRLRVGRAGDGRAVVDGEPTPVSALTGVLCRLAAVYPFELVDIVPEEREYIAAEATAFLLAWLDALPCRVVNAPGPLCLSGPGWRREQWLHAARRLGVPVVPAVRRVVPGNGSAVQTGSPGASVTIVGPGWAVGPRELVGPARRLAAAAGVELLTVWFATVEPGFAVSGADERPDVSTPSVAAPLVELLRGSTS